MHYLKNLKDEKAIDIYIKFPLLIDIVLTLVLYWFYIGFITNTIINSIHALR